MNDKHEIFVGGWLLVIVLAGLSWEICRLGLIGPVEYFDSPKSWKFFALLLSASAIFGWLVRDPRWGILVSGFVFTGFACYHFLNFGQPCGCLSASAVSDVGLVATNLAIGFMAFLYALTLQSIKAKQTKIIFSIAFFALGGLVLRLATTETIRQTELFALCDWLEKRNPLVLSGELSLDQGDWTVYLIDGRCSKCREVVNSKFSSTLGNSWLNHPDIPSLIVRHENDENSWIYRLDTQSYDKTIGVVPAQAQISNGILRTCEPIR
jgi:hypothetical protein